MKSAQKLIDDILTQGLNVEELRQINGAVIGQIKSLRESDAAVKRRTLSEGDKVEWNGRYGYTTGTVTKVNRKNAKVMTNHHGLWNVPLPMLTAIG